MYYLVYKITNKKSNQFYIGRHATKNINDGYMGSGSHRMLKQKKDLEREIIHIAESQEQMIDMEIKLIAENMNNPNCVNYIIGDPTFGGVINHSQKSKQKIKEGMLRYKNSNPEKFAMHMSKAGKSLKGRKQSKEHIKNLSASRRGKPKSEEFKAKVSATLSGRTNRPRETLCKKWKIVDVLNDKTYIVDDRIKFCEEHSIKYPCFNVGTRNAALYKKRWLCEKVV
jgi:hypothetical protein